MNLLFFIDKSPFSNKPYGGSESSTHLIGEKILERGHRVFYLVKENKLFTNPHLQHSNLGEATLLCFKGIVEFSFIIKKINEFFLKRELIKIIDKHNINIIYCHYNLKFLEQLLLIKRQSYNFKIIMRMAGLHWYEVCLKKPHLKTRYERVFNEIDGVNFIHPNLQTVVEEKFEELNMEVNFKNVLVGDIGSSVSVGRGIPYEEINNTQFKMVMATRFSSVQKRQDILIKAISKLDTSLNVKLDLIGAGPRKKEMTNLAIRMGVSERVSFYPFLQQDKLWDKLESTDLLCHACEFEGLSKIIIESMSLGLPVLVSNVPTLNDYIVDYENGFLSENTPEHWAKKIQALIVDRASRIKVSKASMKFIEDNYNPDNNIKHYEDFFLKIINRYRGPHEFNQDKCKP